jgi:hypothetical protein
MDKDTTKSTFAEYCFPLDTNAMMQEIQSLGVDKYTKKLDSITFTRLFVFAQVKQLPSLHQISGFLNEDEGLQAELGLKSISKSQLSRKLRDINPDLLESVFKRCVTQVIAACGVKAAAKRLGQINLIDSSTITMCLSQYPWAKFIKSKAGVKLHLRLAFFDGLSYPDKAVLTPAKPSDRSQMDNLVVYEPGALNVFDRGYVDYRKFDQYCYDGVRFVTRLRENASIAEVYEEKPIKPGSAVIRDEVIKLGSKFRIMTHPIRRIETTDNNGKRIIILTNDFVLDAQEVCDLYKKRWQIELFFKWIKQHLRVKSLYGKSQNATFNQLWIALISFCLLVLLQLKAKYRKKLLDVYERVQRHWAKAFSEFLYYLNRPPSRDSCGRVKTNHELAFALTLRQYEEADTEHLDCLFYDPLI